MRVLLALLMTCVLLDNVANSAAARLRGESNNSMVAKVANSVGNFSNVEKETDPLVYNATVSQEYLDFVQSRKSLNLADVPLHCREGVHWSQVSIGNSNMKGAVKELTKITLAIAKSAKLITNPLVGSLVSFATDALWPKGDPECPGVWEPTMENIRGLIAEAIEEDNFREISVAVANAGAQLRQYMMFSHEGRCNPLVAMAAQDAIGDLDGVRAQVDSFAPRVKGAFAGLIAQSSLLHLTAMQLISVCKNPVDHINEFALNEQDWELRLNEFDQKVDEYSDMMARIVENWEEWRESQIGISHAHHPNSLRPDRWNDGFHDKATGFEQQWRREGDGNGGGGVGPGDRTPLWREMKALKNRIVNDDRARLCQDIVHTFTYSRMKQGHAEDAPNIPKKCQVIELGPYSFMTLKDGMSSDETILNWNSHIHGQEHIHTSELAGTFFETGDARQHYDTKEERRARAGDKISDIMVTMNTRGNQFVHQAKENSVIALRVHTPGATPAQTLLRSWHPNMRQASIPNGNWMAPNRNGANLEQFRFSFAIGDGMRSFQVNGAHGSLENPTTFSRQTGNHLDGKQWTNTAAHFTPKFPTGDGYTLRAVKTHFCQSQRPFLTLRAGFVDIATGRRNVGTVVTPRNTLCVIGFTYQIEESDFPIITEP